MGPIDPVLSPGTNQNNEMLRYPVCTTMLIVRPCADAVTGE